MPKTRKLFICLDDVAMAEFVPYSNPSYGAVYPAHIDIVLKAGGRVVIESDDPEFNKFMALLGLLEETNSNA